MSTNIWVVDLIVNGESDFFCAYSSEKDAYQEAYNLVNEEFVNNPDVWDMTDYNIAVTANDIACGFKSLNSSLCSQAIVRFNDFLYSVKHDMELKVFRSVVSTPTPSSHLDASFFTALYNSNNDNDDDDDDASDSCVGSEDKDNSAVKVSSNGATCRKCHGYNEYASPDMSDGTYCCRQCAAFINIFSSD